MAISLVWGPDGFYSVPVAATASPLSWVPFAGKLGDKVATLPAASSAVT